MEFDSEFEKELKDGTELDISSIQWDGMTESKLYLAVCYELFRLRKSFENHNQAVYDRQMSAMKNCQNQTRVDYPRELRG